MPKKITLVEYDSDVYEGDTMDPDIEYRGSYDSAIGGEKAFQKSEEIEEERRNEEQIVMLEGLHDYIIGISSSSSMSSSSSSSSSSS